MGSELLPWVLPLPELTELVAADTIPIHHATRTVAGPAPMRVTGSTKPEPIRLWFELREAAAVRRPLSC